MNSTGHFDSNPNSRPCSAPSTPLKVNPKLKFSLFDSEDRNSPSSLRDIQSVNMSHVKEIKQHKGSASSYKRWITRNLDQINTAKANSTLDEPFFELKSNKIKEKK